MCIATWGDLAGWKMLRSTCSQSNAGAPWFWMTKGLEFLTFIVIDVCTWSEISDCWLLLIGGLMFCFLHGKKCCFDVLAVLEFKKKCWRQVPKLSSKRHAQHWKKPWERQACCWVLVMCLASGSPVIDFQRCRVPKKFGNLRELYIVFPMHPNACSFPVSLFLMGLLLLLCHDSMHRSTGAVTLSLSQFMLSGS